MAGLLDRLFATPSDQALWALGSGLLGVRRGNEGRALMGGMQAYNDAQQEQRRNELVQLQRKQVEMQLRQQQQQMEDQTAFRSALTDPSILSAGQSAFPPNEMDSEGSPAALPSLDKQKLVQTLLRSGNPALIQKALEMSQTEAAKGVVVGKSLVDPVTGRRIYRDADEKDQWELAPDVRLPSGQMAQRNKVTGEIKAVGSGPLVQNINNPGGGMAGGRPYTPMDKKSDEAAAAELTPWRLGGSADAKGQIAVLRRSIDQLTPGSGVTGGWVGATPDAALPYTNAKAADVKDQVESVVQRNLRLILGAQFTEKEGARLIARAYNPALPPETNAARLKALARQMEAAAKAKDDALAYYNANGTLQGWSGRLPSIDDFYNAIDSAGAVGGAVTNGGWKIEKAD